MTKHVRLVVFLLAAVLAGVGCSSDDKPSSAADGGSAGTLTSAGGAGGTAGAAAGSSGSITTEGGSAISTAGADGRTTAGTGGRGAGRGGMGGELASSGRGGASGAAAGSGGSPTMTPTGPATPLDCGPTGVAIENAGPPKNRVNYVILGDGYTQDQLDTTFISHIQNAMKKRFSEVIGQPYGRYRKFVNICAIKLPSANGPIGSGTTALDCTGDDQSRLANCNMTKVNEAFKANVPASFEIDWKAVVLNNAAWWNTGATVMLWSGANKDAAGAALHEGGHGFHQLADEYTGSESNCAREFNEVNSTADQAKTAGKWDLWLGYDQAGATGMQTTVAGSRYCMSGQYRPTSNSMMNQLFGDKPNTSFNSVSREKMIMDIWRAVTPIDETLPPAGKLDAAGMLQVRVIDPAVIAVDWSVDGNVVKQAGGETFDLAAQALGTGSHTITAKAYDTAGMELIRYTTGTQYGRMNWARSQQTVSWTIDVP